MPATYAHYSFGKQVLNQLDGDLKKIILENLNLFHIGLHGPDILFYYKPLSSNPINKTGHGLHSSSAKKIFEKSKNIINNCDDSDRACAYITGYICHFMLDSECHPCVRKNESNKLTHSEIETEFERMLIEENNLEPLSFKPTSHIIPTFDSAKCVSLFYEGVSVKEILSALKSMKLYLNILVAPGFFKRWLIISALKLSGNYRGMIGLIMNYDKNPECIEINKNLYEIYINAIIPTRNLINEFYQNLNKDIPINERFNRTFG